MEDYYIGFEENKLTGTYSLYTIIGEFPQYIHHDLILISNPETIYPKLSLNKITDISLDFKKHLTSPVKHLIENANNFPKDKLTVEEYLTFLLKEKKILALKYDTYLLIGKGTFEYLGLEINPNNVIQLVKLSSPIKLTVNGNKTIIAMDSSQKNHPTLTLSNIAPLYSLLTNLRLYKQLYTIFHRENYHFSQQIDELFKFQVLLATNSSSKVLDDYTCEHFTTMSLISIHLTEKPLLEGN